MAPPPDDKAAAEVNEESTPERRISSILFVIAMQTEGAPLVNRFQLAEEPDSVFPEGVPWLRYYGKYKNLDINIVCPGKDKILEVDSVGTVSASLLTHASIQAIQIDLIINAGTSGGFKAKRASTGVASDVAFHHRRIPIPVLDLYGVGIRQAFSTPNLSRELNLKGAGIAYVADLLKVPAIFLKAVTDIVDGDKPTAEEFLQNLAAVTAALD